MKFDSNDRIFAGIESRINNDDVEAVKNSIELHALVTEDILI